MELKPKVIDGKEYVELYSELIDVTGVNELKKFGNIYTIKHASGKKAKPIKVKADELNIEPDYIEIKVK